MNINEVRPILERLAILIHAETKDAENAAFGDILNDCLKDGLLTDLEIYTLLERNL